MNNSLLSEEQVAQLVGAAKASRGKAMAFKSKLAWGASVLTEEGKVYGGCNIDGIISDEGMCAERVAINHAVTHGHYRFSAICLYGQELGVPCGSCLQYALMFCQIKGGNIPVVMAQESGAYEISSVKQLLPRGYETRVFGEELRDIEDKPED